jgi:hypothetical protein
MRERRAFLSSIAALGTVPLAGCSNSIELPGSEPELYPEDIESELYPTESDIPSDWTFRPEADDDYVTYESGSETVAVQVRIENSISEAESEMSSDKEEFRDPQNIDIGDEAFWDTKDSFGHTQFRHVNAIAIVIAASETGLQIEPSVSASHDYARIVFEKWEDEYPSATSG